MKYLECPLRTCSWRTVDRSHLGTVVVVAGTEADEYLTGTRRPKLETRDAVVVTQDELREHLGAEHREELQLMLAGVDGGRGVPVLAMITQHIDGRQVQDAADLVAGVLVPQMRARMAQDLAKKNLRPLDPWPAVTVHRFVWTSHAEFRDAMLNGAPSGMRELQPEELEAGRTPDLYQLELRTEAVQDSRTVQL